MIPLQPGNFTNCIDGEADYLSFVVDLVHFWVVACEFNVVIFCISLQGLLLLKIDTEDFIP